MEHAKDTISASTFINLFGSNYSKQYGTYGNGYGRHWSQGFLLGDDGSLMASGVYSGGGSAYLDFSDISYGTSYGSTRYGVFLVSNGGLTWSSNNDTEIQAIQNSFAVPVPLLGIGGIAMLSLFGVRRKKSD